MKKRYSAIILSLVMAAALAGCGDSSSKSKSSESKESENSISVNSDDTLAETELTDDNSVGSGLSERDASLLGTISGELVESGECGENGDNVIYELYDDRTLVIKGTGNMAEYSYLNYDGYSPLHGCETVETVIVLSGVTKIGNAFLAESTASAVYLPDTVTDITQAFINCYCLKKIELPENLESIGKSAFSGCKHLVEVNIPDSVTSIEYHAFLNCSDITDLTISDKVTEIGEEAFLRCDNLTIHGTSGSVAESAASENNVHFVSVNS